MAKKLINLNIPEEFLSEVDEYCDKIGLTRSAFIITAMNQYLMQKKVADSIGSIQQSIRSLAKTGNMSEEELKELGYFEYLVDSLRK